jgi:hypothetical protein
MKFIKRFEIFKEEFSSAGPRTAPTTKPSQPGVKPGTKPGQKPSKPSPIRRDKPSVSPAPKAEKEKKLPTATIEDVIEKFAELTNQKI